jgi:hypothetical protein
VASKRANQELPVIARLEVRHRNYLAPDGSISRPLPAFASDARLFIALYRSLLDHSARPATKRYFTDNTKSHLPLLLAQYSLICS